MFDRRVGCPGECGAATSGRRPPVRRSRQASTLAHALSQRTGRLVELAYLPRTPNHRQRMARHVGRRAHHRRDAGPGRRARPRPRTRPPRREPRFRARRHRPRGRRADSRLAGRGLPRPRERRAARPVAGTGQRPGHPARLSRTRRPCDHHPGPAPSSPPDGALPPTPPPPPGPPSRNTPEGVAGPPSRPGSISSTTPPPPRPGSAPNETVSPGVAGGSWGGPAWRPARTWSASGPRRAPGPGPRHVDDADPTPVMTLRR